jgi:hypothetical protein
VYSSSQGSADTEYAGRNTLLRNEQNQQGRLLQVYIEHDDLRQGFWPLVMVEIYIKSVSILNDKRPDEKKHEPPPIALDFGEKDHDCEEAAMPKARKVDGGEYE